jgi:hypothetical protein
MSSCRVLMQSISARTYVSPPLEENLINGIAGREDRQQPRKGGGRDEEEGIEQSGSCQGGRILEQLQEGGEGESWQDMPQVKGLKELKLPVGNKNGRRQIWRENTQSDRHICFIPIRIIH